MLMSINHSNEPQINMREVAFGSDLYRSLLDIRSDVLRKPIGMELRAKDIAADASEFHFAAMDGDRAIGCLVLKPLTADTAQLRQMAVLESYRGRNIGARLVRYAEDFARGNGFTTIETRAWRTAEGFYRRQSYQSFEHEFADEHTLLMRKPLR
jgi:GNAT superfamily N-acetyltransferase